MKKLVFFGLILVMVFSTSCRAKHDKLIVGLIKPSINHLPISYALETGLLDHADYELVYFSSGWELQEAIVGKKVDIAVMPFTYAWNAASKGYPIRIVSFLERETDGIVAKRNLTSITDLQGKSIGLLKASSIDILMQDLAERTGFTFDPIYFRTPNESISALQAGSVDAIVLYVPLIQKMSNDYHVLHWFSEDYAAHPCCNLTVNTQMLTEAKTKLTLQLIDTITKINEQIAARDESILRFATKTYGLSGDEVSDALSHTVFITGLDDSGRNFERQMIDIAVKSGYQDRHIADHDIYLELTP